MQEDDDVRPRTDVAEVHMAVAVGALVLAQVTLAGPVLDVDACAVVVFAIGTGRRVQADQATGDRRLRSAAVADVKRRLPREFDPMLAE